ncbi:hypothetical protein L798_09458 [Zootermopsis nevadensis]|uniref:Uncharacterized protein n=1 Tax=Zootermopsis nevadensis TaxID=136037 RepID=A0A067RCW4_ZOONE|nr:hypothetical protein L798_09458 [Zootermopsis nevadensis]
MPDTNYHDYPTYQLGATANGSSAKTTHHHYQHNNAEKHVLFFPPATPQSEKASPQQQQQTKHGSYILRIDTKMKTRFDVIAVRTNQHQQKVDSVLSGKIPRVLRNLVFTIFHTH